MDLAPHHLKARGEGYARGDAVGNPAARPEPAPQLVGKSHRGVQWTEVGEPGGDLQFRPNFYVFRVLLRAWQKVHQPPGSFESGYVGDGMFAAVEEAFDRVIQSPYPGRKPQFLGREERRLGIEDDHCRNGLRVSETALLASNFVGDADPLRPLGP